MVSSAAVPRSTAVRNRLLALLPPAVLTATLPQLELIALPLKQILYEPDAAIAHAYFPLSGVVSLLTLLDEGMAVEAALVGSNGVAGIPLFFGGTQDTVQALVQAEGMALRLPAETCRRLMERELAVRTVFGHFAEVLLTQMGQSAACNLVHPLEQRCARWLLEMQDRVGQSSFPLTQAFLANMLGVRRPSVTVAAGTLQHAGLIRYRRGQIEVLDRDRLLAATCECYRVITDVVDRYLPLPATQPG